jgi:subtilase family serine protease
MAPGARIVYVGAQSPTDQDLVGAINLVVANNLASIVSNSYGMVEQQGNDFVVWRGLATQAGLKGIGLYFSSGDSGDETFSLGVPSADFPASLDLVTAVGGTSLAIGRTGQRLWEVGWETGASYLTPGADGKSSWAPGPPGYFVFGAGGGTSFVFTQPAWQAGVVPDSIATSGGSPARVVPDVAMVADPITGYLIGETDASGTYNESPIGGTSLACPLFAGTIALAQQNAGRAFGFANPLLYKAHRGGGFHDVEPPTSPQAVTVQPGIVATFNYPSLTIKTAQGYDNVTGVGTPDGANFLDATK